MKCPSCRRNHPRAEQGGAACQADTADHRALVLAANRWNPPSEHDQEYR